MNYTLDFDQIKKDLMFLIGKYAGEYIPGSFYSDRQRKILITYRIPTLEEIASKLEIPNPHTNILKNIGDLLLKKFMCFDLERFAAGDRNYRGDSNNFFIKESATRDVVNFLVCGGDRHREDPTLDFYRMAASNLFKKCKYRKKWFNCCGQFRTPRKGFSE